MTMKSERKISRKRGGAMVGSAVLISVAAGLLGMAGSASADGEEDSSGDVGAAGVAKGFVDKVSYYEICGETDAESGLGLRFKSQDATDRTIYIEREENDDEFDLSYEQQGNGIYKDSIEFLDGEGDYYVDFDGDIRLDLDGAGPDDGAIVDEYTFDVDCTDGEDDPGEPNDWLGLFTFNAPFTTAPAAPAALPKTGSDSNSMLVLAPVMVLLGGGLVLVRRRLATA